jgi:hypothetical protein
MITYSISRRYTTAEIDQMSDDELMREPIIMLQAKKVRTSREFFEKYGHKILKCIRDSEEIASWKG